MTQPLDSDTNAVPTPAPRRRFAGLGVRAATALTAAGLIGGGAAGGFLIANAASPSPSQTPAAGSGTTAPGTGTTPTFHSNENSTHEQGESAQREAQENAGQAPFQQPAAAAGTTGWTG